MENFVLPDQKDIEKDLFNYHLKQTIRFGYVDKDSGKYFLTDLGKDHVSYLDFESRKAEKTPKVSVMTFVFRDDLSEVLLCKRLKHPYLGALTPVTGKVRQGEEFTKTAIREVKEETNIKLKKCNHLGFLRSIDRDANNGDLLFDAIFSVHYSEEFTGILKTVTESEEVENVWMKVDQAIKDKNLLAPSKEVLRHIRKNGLKPFPFTTLDQSLDKY